MKRGILLPDIQDGPSRPKAHLAAAARYIADKGLDPIIQIGDWGDYPSLSWYDKGKLRFEGRRLSKDWDSHRLSVEIFEGALLKTGFKPRRKVYTKGNHEARIDRAAQDNPELAGSLPDVLGYMTFQGWESHEYLQVAQVEGVQVSHLFPKSLNGRVTNSGVKYGAPSANVMIRANMASCIAGHKPGYNHDMLPGPRNKILCGLIAGSFYLHKETYLGPGVDNDWKGVVTLNRLSNGYFEPCPVNVKWLMERYGK